MDFSIYHMWTQMGVTAKFVVALLLLMSVYSIGVAVDRWIALRKGRRQSVGYIGMLQQMLSTPGHLQDVVGQEQKWTASPVARVIGNGASEFARGLKRLGAKRADASEVEQMVDVVSRSMDRAKVRELSNMKRGLSALATISSSAPFVGLFGTVFGIITAFQKMGDPNGGGGGGLATVSAGISEALLTTAVGLAVAIVSVWFYNYFTDSIDQLTIDVDETAGEILETMLREAKGADVP
jgi:biopolymer transport protein ExbB/TolQ